MESPIARAVTDLMCGRSLIIVLLFLAFAHANGTEDNVVVRTVPAPYDYSSAVNDIIFVEEYAGVGRVSGTCMAEKTRDANALGTVFASARGHGNGLVAFLEKGGGRPREEDQR